MRKYSTSSGFRTYSCLSMLLFNLFVVVVLAGCESESLPENNPAAQAPTPNGPVSATRASPIKLSDDPYTQPEGQHETATEPSIASNGSMLVAAFHVARMETGGAMNIGWATSADSGATWTKGVLSGTTQFAGGSYFNIYDPTVAYDAKHSTWMISAIVSGGAAVVVMRSSNGTDWQPPVVVHAGGLSDKSWLVCDNTATSPYYGNCYLEFDDEAQSGLILMSRSTDGGQNWDSARATADNATGISGFPVVQPSGTVIVPTLSQQYNQLFSFRSNDGGNTWSTSTPISSVSFEPNRADLRVAPNPSAVVDSSGKVLVAWIDCRFRPICDANDIVTSTSTDGNAWTDVKKTDLGLTDKGQSLIFPGLGINAQSQGASGEIGMVFYAVGGSGCTTSPTSCEIVAQYSSSKDIGVSWSPPRALSEIMIPDWISTTGRGKMIGDYSQVSFANGIAVPVFSIASKPQNGLDYNQGIFAFPQ